MRSVRHVAIKNANEAGLNPAGTGNNAEQRRFADAVGSDQTDHAAGGEFETDRVERRGTRITLRDVVQPRDRPDRGVHCGGSLCSEAGHAAAESVLTYATPGSPLRTDSARWRRRSGSICTRMRNISLSRSLWVSTVLGVNCAWVAMNDTLAGMAKVG